MQEWEGRKVRQRDATRNERESEREAELLISLRLIQSDRKASAETERKRGRGVALMGSIDRASVQGQQPCPW